MRIEGNCVSCGVWRYSLHRDHIVPKWQGGSDAPSNIQHLCANCHEDKTQTERESVEGREFARQAALSWHASERARTVGASIAAGQVASGYTGAARAKAAEPLRGRKHPPNCGHCIAVRGRKLS